MRCTILPLALLAILAASAAAQSPLLTLDPFDKGLPPKTLLLGTPKNADYAARITLYWENDGGFAKPNNRTDRHYTAGAGAALSWQAPWVNALIAQVPSLQSEFDPKNSDYAMGLIGALDIYTPEHIERTAPIQNDRPYAGFTYAGLFFQRANRFPSNGLPPVWESLEFDLGILGPSSLAENVQNMVHHYYHYVRPQGWDNQLHDEPEFSIKYNRRWRWDAWRPPESWKPWSPRLQILPEAGMTAGSLLDEIHAGAVFRLGWNMPDDFGPGRLAMPNDFTWQAPCACGNYGLKEFFAHQSFTLYARPFGQAVAHNALLTGDNFRHDDPVTVNPTPAIFGIESGLTYRLGKFFELSYSQTYQSPEFQRQHGWDAFASIQLAFFVAW